MTPLASTSFSKNTSYLIIAVLILLALALLFPILKVINKRLILKDCYQALKYSEQYPLYQPDQALVKTCAQYNINFKP